MDNRDSRALFGVILTIMGCLLFVAPTQADEYEIAPVTVRSAVIVKVLALDKDLAGDITVYVLGDPDFADEFRKALGMTTGAATISSVEAGDDLPESPPDILYVGDAAMTNEAIAYTRRHKILSVTGLPASVAGGVCLGVCLMGGKPRILLNTGAAKAEGIHWNPAILKVADKI